MSDSLERQVAFLPVAELADLVRRREVSPVELATVFLGRLERLGPQLNAVVTVARERAMEEARRAEAELARGEYRGPLHGVPYGVKDLLATAGGIPTTWGAAPFRGQVLDHDAAVVERLREAGAVLCAKLAMIELAGGMGYRQPNASFTGPCKNPWDPGTWSGGSSSGSGAAVAAGLLPFAIGSETWGSILSPANNCGVAGLRPTYGLVSRYGAMALSWTLDKLGPLALTAQDCGLVLEAIAGPDTRDPSTASRSFRYEDHRDEGPFRLGIPAGVAQDADPDQRRNFEAALKTLEQVATVEEVRLPDLPYEAVARTILNVESVSAFEEFIEEGGLTGLTAPESRYLPYARWSIPARDYLRALRLRGVIAREATRALAGYDALVAPSRPTVATGIDRPFRSAIRGAARDMVGALGNVAGLPAVSVPSGFNGKGLPTGIQFMGRPFGDGRVLAVARAYQALTDWHRRHPPAFVPPAGP